MIVCKVHGQVTAATHIKDQDHGGCMFCKINDHDYDGRPMSWEEIGGALSISPREAREIAGQALRKLTRSMASA